MFYFRMNVFPNIIWIFIYGLYTLSEYSILYMYIKRICKFNGLFKHSLGNIPFFRKRWKFQSFIYTFIRKHSNFIRKGSVKVPIFYLCIPFKNISIFSMGFKFQSIVYTFIHSAKFNLQISGKEDFKYSNIR